MKDKLRPDKKYILAISGGPDSMLLASLVYKFFSTQKWDLQNLILVHCNH
jgi:tRNA(Ile)-lysidine synthase TilS/MesJ